MVSGIIKAADLAAWIKEIDKRLSDIKGYSYSVSGGFAYVTIVY